MQDPLDDAHWERRVIETLGRFFSEGFLEDQGTQGFVSDEVTCEQNSRRFWIRPETSCTTFKNDH